MMTDSVMRGKERIQDMSESPRNIAPRVSPLLTSSKSALGNRRRRLIGFHVDED